MTLLGIFVKKKMKNVYEKNNCYSLKQVTYFGNNKYTFDELFENAVVSRNRY